MNVAETTLNKLIKQVSVSNPHYRSSSKSDRQELAKLFIRKKLCPGCRAKIINKTSNEFRRGNARLCSRCSGSIQNDLNRAMTRKVPGYILQRNKEARDRLLYEIYAKTHEFPEVFLARLHHDERMTAPAIKEHLAEKYQIEIGNRHLTLIMRDMGILNTNLEALRKRIVTGRMDYSKRKINYKKRKIDYTRRERLKKDGWGPENKFLFVTADKDLRQAIERLSKKHELTMSQTVRILLDSLEGEKIPKGCKTYADKLRRAIKGDLSCLADSQRRASRGVKIIITKGS